MTRLILTWTIFGLCSTCDDHHFGSSFEIKKESIKLDDLPTVGRFKVAPYVRAAALLQDMGKEKACEQLARLGKMADEDGQVPILCRLLFAKKENKEFPSPPFGGPSHMGGTSDIDWPLSPIEIVDAVPFFIVESYGGSGPPPHAFSLFYLNYCREHCEWSKTRFGNVNRKTIEKALRKLLASKKWRRPLTDYERALLISQTK